MACDELLITVQSSFEKAKSCELEWFCKTNIAFARTVHVRNLKLTLKELVYFSVVLDDALAH